MLARLLEWIKRRLASRRPQVWKNRRKLKIIRPGKGDRVP